MLSFVIDCEEGMYGLNCAEVCACGANAECDNVEGCVCLEGYKDIDSDFACVDIDECTESASPPCPEDVTCDNTEGSYTCLCPTGQTYIGDVCTGEVAYRERCINTAHWAWSLFCFYINLILIPITRNPIYL